MKKKEKDKKKDEEVKKEEPIRAIIDD